ncbi:MAG: MFS transporter [Chloroflexi bacterium]|nr:MFS transporter [Chloroflexota bacterium]
MPGERQERLGASKPETGGASHERLTGGQTGVAVRAGGDGMGVEGAGGFGMGVGGGGAAISLRNLRTFDSFRNPVFRLFFGAMVGQMFALNMQMMARSLLVYRLTGSATALGVIALANSVPMLFFSLFGGVIADRVRKKYVILAGQAASALLAFGIALALWAGLLSKEQPNSWLLLVAYSVLAGTIMGLMMPARQAILPEIVGGERLMNAISLTMLEQNGLRLLAPAVAGFLIDWIGFQAIYFTMSGMYCLAAVFVLLMPLTGTMTLRGRGALTDMIEGFRYVRRETTILTILVLTLVMVFLSMPYMTLLPIFTEDILKVGATGMGILMSVSGIGAMASAVVLASLPNKKRGIMFLVGGVLLGLALAGFSFSGTWALSLVLIALVGVGQTIRMTLANTLLQYYVADEYRGRVMSLYMMEFGLTSFGVFFAAILADTSLGVQWSVGGLAILLIAMSLLFIAFSPRIRRLD